MGTFSKIDTVKLPRISQIDCLPQNRLDPEEFEQARREKKIGEEKKQLMSQTSALKGRKGTGLTSRLLPPISQISLGGRQLPEETSVHGEGSKLPPISQVSCLGGYVDEKNLFIKPIKSRIRDSDSDFIKLSKSGGQKDLLCYSVDRERSRDGEANAKELPRSTRYIPGVTSEADRRWRPSHWSDFTRQKPVRHGDNRMVWR